MQIKNYTLSFFLHFFFLNNQGYLIHTPSTLISVCLFHLISIFIQLVLSLQCLCLNRFVTILTFISMLLFVTKLIFFRCLNYCYGGDLLSCYRCKCVLSRTLKKRKKKTRDLQFNSQTMDNVATACFFSKFQVTCSGFVKLRPSLSDCGLNWR